jgi:hypothetical protein
MKVFLQRIPAEPDGSFELPEKVIGYQLGYDGYQITDGNHRPVPIVAPPTIIHVEAYPVAFDDTWTARAVWIMQEEE